MRKDAMPNVVVPASCATPGARDGTVTQAWLASFHDPELDALVREAIAYNADLRVAQARVEQAAAYLKSSGATLYPQVNILARGGGKMADSSGLSGVGSSRAGSSTCGAACARARRSPSSNTKSAQLDTEYARQSIAALVAKGWFLATEARMQKAQATAMRESSEKLVGLAQDRLRVGRGDEFDVATAQANVATLRDTERSLDASYAQALRGLEVLRGTLSRRSVGRAGEARAMAGRRPGRVCLRSCWSAGPTSLPRSGASRARSIKSRKRRRRACRGSRSPRT